jgi:membrane associated rhomboid family serine protease
MAVVLSVCIDKSMVSVVVRHMHRQTQYWEHSRSGCVGGWDGPSRSVLGASGAVNTIVVFSVLVSPFSTVLIYGILPVPAWAFGLLWFGKDINGLIQVTYVGG